ncbi:MAG: DUF5652 family protein [Candidatus Parcubacteria bacterium]|nr:DUF5652 family protein [Candidatus Parcubacteria bacterium]
MSQIPTIPPLLQFAILIWSFAWKGLALWNASKNNQRNWFIAIFATILIVNTMGILEIIYLFRFAKKRLTLNDLYFWKSKKV